MESNGQKWNISKIKTNKTKTNVLDINLLKTYLKGENCCFFIVYANFGMLTLPKSYCKYYRIPKIHVSNIFQQIGVLYKLATIVREGLWDQNACQ